MLNRPFENNILLLNKQLNLTIQRVASIMKLKKWKYRMNVSLLLAFNDCLIWERKSLQFLRKVFDLFVNMR